MRKTPDIQIKRVYDPPEPSDGSRILIDRLWPRGLSKARAQIDFWARDCSPSTELRRWYDHSPEKWQEFKARYFIELDAHPEALQTLMPSLRGAKMTLLFASKEPRFNNAAAFKEYLELILDPA